MTKSRNNRLTCCNGACALAVLQWQWLKMVFWPWINHWNLNQWLLSGQSYFGGGGGDNSSAQIQPGKLCWLRSPKSDSCRHRQYLFNVGRFCPAVRASTWGQGKRTCAITSHAFRFFYHCDWNTFKNVFTCPCCLLAMFRQSHCDSFFLGAV